MTIFWAFGLKGRRTKRERGPKDSTRRVDLRFPFACPSQIEVFGEYNLKRLAPKSHFIPIAPNQVELKI